VIMPPFYFAGDYVIEKPTASIFERKFFFSFETLVITCLFTQRQYGNPESSFSQLRKPRFVSTFQSVSC